MSESNEPYTNNLPMNLLRQAKHVALVYHFGQKYNDEPYANHVMRVADRCKDIDEKIVALLHDILEDTSFSRDNIKYMFGDRILDAVVCITRQKGEDYFEEYIKRVKTNDLAKVVKIADLEENLSYCNLPSPSRIGIKNKAKYEKALEYLRS